MNSDNHTDAATNATGEQPREYQERLERYGQDFLQVIRQESPPGQELRQGLRQLQQSLELTDQEAEAIEAKVDRDFQTQAHEYRELLYRYEQEFSETIRQEFPLSSASQSRLWQLRESLGLQSIDVIKIEGQLISQKSELSQKGEQHPQDVRLPGSLEAKLVDDINLEPTTSVPFSGFAEKSTTHLPLSSFAESDPNPQPPTLPNTQLDPPSLRSDWDVDYTHLQDLLEANQWKKADEETLNVMLQATGRSQEGWLDAIAIAKFPCTDLHTIDRLWGRYSDEQFSFRVQYRLYSGVTISTENAVNPGRSDEERALEFSKNVGWWVKRLEFLRYYNQLDFTLQAPDGHLPALWFWTIPWGEAFQHGGIGSGRGGCRIDHQIITAFIDRLNQCGFN